MASGSNVEEVVVMGVAGLLVGGLVIWAVDALTRDPQEVRAIRQQADQELRRKAVEIANSHWNPVLRERARKGVLYADALWFGRGKSGDPPPQGLPSEIHGNWCGAGGGGPIMDDLDRACFEHDRAYAWADRVHAWIRSGRVGAVA